MSEKLIFREPYNVHRNKTVSLTVDVKNAMDSSIDVYRGNQQIRHVERHTGAYPFENLGKGSDWEGQTMKIFVNVTDISPASNRMEVEITIDGGASPKTETLYKTPSNDGEEETFFGKFIIS